MYNRKLDEQNIQMAKELLQENVSSDKIRTFLSKKSGKQITTRDILNLKLAEKSKTIEGKS